MAATFTPEDVRRLAELARVDLTDEELVLFAGQLSGILAFAAEVQAVDTTSISAVAGKVAGTLREDQVLPSCRREDVLAASPTADTSTGFFTVPRVFAE